MGDAFSTARWIITTNGHPDNLAVSNSGDGTDVTFDHFKNHFGAKIEDAISTESRELPAQSLSKGVSQGFLAHGRESLVNKIGLSTHRTSRFVRFFWARTEGGFPNVSSCSR